MISTEFSQTMHDAWYAMHEWDVNTYVYSFGDRETHIAYIRVSELGDLEGFRFRVWMVAQQKTPPPIPIAVDAAYLEDFKEYRALFAEPML